MQRFIVRLHSHWKFRHSDHRPNRRLCAGQGLVEFALTLPLLILIMVGVLDLGRITATYVILTNAAREGARYGALHQSSGTIQADVSNRAKAEATGSLVDSSQINPIICTPSTCKGSIGDSLKVQVTYPFSFITTYLFAGMSTMNISTSATFEIQSK
jgi:Flp pilus assembly protein TadG